MSNTNVPASPPPSAEKLLEQAAVYNVSQRDTAAAGKTVKVLAGYRVVNVGTGHLITVNPRGIKVVNGQVVGLKAGLRLATAAELKAGVSVGKGGAS